MKRWRALLRLLEPFLGAQARVTRFAARDLARELADARDAQSVLDALEDATKGENGLSARSLATLRGRIEEIRRAAEVTSVSAAMRARLMTTLDEASHAIERWPLDDAVFSDVAGSLADTYRRARGRIPPDWASADARALHELRQRVVEHRYQMELVQPLWPKLGKLWVNEAQQLRDRLGGHQNLVLMAGLMAPHQPLARWRSRLLPMIAARQAEHVAAARRRATRLFAESPKAFQRRLEMLWESGGGRA
jgi:CHAD domain-containing protein